MIAANKEKSHRLRDFFLYMAIGILVAASAIALGIYQAKIGTKLDGNVKWVGFAVLTLLIFWWALSGHRSFWRDKRFWKLLGIFTAIHVILGIGILVRVTVTSLWPFILVTPLEYYVLSALLSRMLEAPLAGRESSH